MKTLRLKHPAVLAPAFLMITPLAQQEEIQFAPEVDTTVTKTFSTDMDFNLDDFSLLVNGEDMGAMMGAFEMSMTNESEIGVTDTYLAVADGRPTKLKRTFNALETNTSVDFATEFGGESQDIPGSSPLEGATVVYTWDPEEEAYSVAYEEEGGDEDLLEGLLEDFDLRTVLPDGPVSVGDSWVVDTKALAELAMQGNSLHILPEEMGDEEMEMMEMFQGEDFMSLMEDMYQGTVTCTLKGTREVEGETLADIEIDIELSAATDLSEMMMGMIAQITESQGEEMPPFDLSTADLNADMEGEGILVWNLTRDVAHGLEGSGDFSAAFDLSASVEEGGESIDIDASVELSGSMTQEIEVTFE